MNVNGKIAVITGASSGLGASLAKVLVAKGAIVYGISRNEKKLSEVKKELGDNFFAVTMDIAYREKLNTWIQQTFSESHLPDILINNAGAGYFAQLDSLPAERWDEMMNTNLNGVFNITSWLIPLMKTNGETCHIINIGSILGKTARAESAAYSATKFAMQGFSEALFKELRSYKIKVTCVNPGSIDTRFFEQSGIESHKNMMQPDDIAALILHVLETPDNLLVDEITLRPLIPNPPPTGEK
ncbi:SDR family NAD(P)-dependent oxidoreductase [Hanamia caeni]|jgi:NADP-dependent 3-hydroxy acid dehydrogenase YdfG|uniref:SDR family NAD(P)-dependent oxidoreductase n=1 Tax=Hanamia caeni TaxID=2294116 RepID=A0A3M9N7Q6_9BACT|nr:SDR family NAD(P)-dependent oxidoreductase [Hanamia caeni]RNI33771.1 SDR family NAD(P)-dependent oxidoreductase [Hanamia caeni]